MESTVGLCSAEEAEAPGPESGVVDSDCADRGCLDAEIRYLSRILVLETYFGDQYGGRCVKVGEKPLRELE